MINKILKLFLSPRGRIGRQTFILCFLGWLAFYLLQSFWFKKTGNNLFNFFLSLTLLFINVQIIFSIYGKRLHDLGRSVRPVIAIFILMIIGGIVLMLNFGGLEYFDTVYQNPDIVEDETAMRQLTETYQQSVKDNLPQIRLILAVIPLLFTFWLAAKPGKNQANQYGDPISA
jgi:uncharacterized membrane protein YhaH (DUF805 family)